jgi:hypothetical protein
VIAAGRRRRAADVPDEMKVTRETLPTLCDLIVREPD